MDSSGLSATIAIHYKINNRRPMRSPEYNGCPAVILALSVFTLRCLNHKRFTFCSFTAQSRSRVLILFLEFFYAVVVLNPKSPPVS